MKIFLFFIIAQEDPQVLLEEKQREMELQHEFNNSDNVTIETCIKDSNTILTVDPP